LEKSRSLETGPWLLLSNCCWFWVGTLESDEKKDESPRLSFLPPAVGLSAYFFPRIRSPSSLTVTLLQNNQDTHLALCHC